MKKIKKNVMIGIILMLTGLLPVCSGSTKKTGNDQETGTSVEVKKSNQSPFENESLVALELRTMNQVTTYDAGAPVIVRVELFSPRSFAVLTHNRYKAKNEETIELPEAAAGLSDKPWWQEMTVHITGEGIDGEVPFHAIPSLNEKKLDLGSGEVGSIKLILGENTFPKVGKYHIKAIWKGGKYGSIVSNNLPVILATDYLAETDRDLLRLKIMLARKENDAALELGKKLVETHPASYRVRYNLAEAYEKNNNSKEALAQYQHALTLFHQGGSGKPVETPIGLLIKIKALMGKDKN